MGPLPWLGPRTIDILQNLGLQYTTSLSQKSHSAMSGRVMVVPLAFTSDHIETLYEIDYTFADAARAAGISNIELNFLLFTQLNIRLKFVLFAQLNIVMIIPLAFHS